MVQKVFCIVLVLLWTMPLFMAMNKIKTNYISKQQINYREEDEMNVMNIKTDKDGAIDLSRFKQDTSIQYR